MSRLDALRHVAGLLGIAIRHVDALGAVHEPDEETLARLIAAFGLPSDPHAAADRLAEEEHAAPFGLEPLHVLAAEDPTPALALRLPPGGGDVEWQCRLEDGSEIAGRSSGAALPLPPGLPLGYHRLALTGAGDCAEIGLAVAPQSCHLPAGLLPRARSWGLTVQLYGLHRTRDWGIGDFGDLGRLCRRGGDLGAATIGVNPLHALFAAEPRHISPYSPSSRTWLDYRYIDVTQVPGFGDDAIARSLMPDTAKRGDLVDYPGVAARKRLVLEALFRRFRSEGSAAGGRQAEAFRHFCREGGTALAEFATFEALHEHFLASGAGFSWHDWPPALQNPRSPAVAEFARARAERVEFFQFLQWQADRQLAAAAAAGREHNLSIGLYRDLAVGVNPHGADAWADRELVAPGASIGAPPDALSRAGQNWGLAPLNPLALRRRGFAPLIAALRANMRHAGLLRIDHVMGLQRLYWVASGSPATSGAYVDYPFRDLLRLLALESRRNDCAIVGEDLGTVPDGFREAMRRADVLSCRVFLFERGPDGSFTPPAAYPPVAVAAAATHDLATLKGFWLGRDIDWRRRLRLYPDARAEATEAAERRRDRGLLLAALAREGLLSQERFDEFLPSDDCPRYSDDLGEAIFAYLARSQSRLMLAQVEDVLGEAEQANLPGTTEGHPNWRRRLSVGLDQLCAGSALAGIAQRIAAARRSAAPED